MMKKKQKKHLQKMIFQTGDYGYIDKDGFVS